MNGKRYAVGTAPSYRGGYISPQYLGAYNSLVEARKTGFSSLMKVDFGTSRDHLFDVLYVYDMEHEVKGHPVQIGMMYRSPIGPNMRIEGKHYVMFENMNVRPRHIWFLKKDGTLGMRRY